MVKDRHATDRHVTRETGLAGKAAGRDKLWQVISI